MSPHIEVRCGCGRALWARPGLAGGSVRCWECGAEVPVPRPRMPKGRLAEAMGDAARAALRSDAVGPVLAGAVGLTLLLLVPRVGLALAAVALAALAPSYLALVARGGRAAPTAPGAGDVVETTDEPAGPADAGADAGEVDGGFGRWGRRAAGFALGAFAVAALAAPVAVRNGGHVLPGPDPAPGPRAWLTLALGLAAWLVVPPVLAAASAHDRKGRIGPLSALGGLARHPLATLAALLLLPAGLLAAEVTAAAFAWQQGFLPELVADLFPTPADSYREDGVYLTVRYGDYELAANTSDTPERLSPAYLAALARGYTLTGTMPAMAPYGSRLGRLWVLFDSRPVVYRQFRTVLTLGVLSAAGLLLAVQARWLGLIAAAGAARPLAVQEARPREIREALATGA